MTTQTLTIARITKLESYPRVPAVAQVLVQIAFVLTQWSIQHRTRTELAELDAHILADIGVSPEQARKECEKWFWQI